MWTFSLNNYNIVIFNFFKVKTFLFIIQSLRLMTKILYNIINEIIILHFF